MDVLVVRTFSLHGPNYLRPISTTWSINDNDETHDKGINFGGPTLKRYVVGIGGRCPMFC
jgi:hypothetical protein